MAIARVFKSGSSQAIRLPKEFRVAERELEICRRGDEIVLRPPAAQNIGPSFTALALLPDDFLPDRADAPPQTREGL